MRQRWLSVLLGCGLVIGLFVLSGLQSPIVQAESTNQSNSCAGILEDAARLADLDAEGVDWIQDGDGGCEVRYCWECNAGMGKGQDVYLGIQIANDFQPFECWAGNTQTESSRCKLSTFHGYPARLSYKQVRGRPGTNFDWYLEQEGIGYIFHVERNMPFSNENTNADPDKVMGLAEALWEAAGVVSTDGDAPPTDPEPANSDCAGVTPEDLRQGGLSTLNCRLHCDPDSMSDDELWGCIYNYSGVSGDGIENPDQPIEPNPLDEQPFVPENPSDGDDYIPDEEIQPTDQSDSLGPLATSPLVPLAGGLIGTVAGWLVSIAVNSGAGIKPIVPTPRPTGPSPVSPPSPVVEAGIPLDLTPTPPPTPTDHLWDLATNFVGNGSTVVGTLSEFFDFEDSAETVQQIGDSIRDWHANPTAKTAEKYVKTVGKTINVRLKNLSDSLGNISLVIDGVDAVSGGLEVAAERGYKGSDKVLAVGAELSKKILNLALTKNPVVGLVNTAFGSASELILGKDEKLDIGSMIELGSDMWDATTQEYAGYTEGSYLPGNYAEELAKDATIQRKDQYLHGIRRIKKLIELGKITREDGIAQIRALQNIVGGES